MAAKRPHLSPKRKLEDFTSEPELQKKRTKEKELPTEATDNRYEGQGFVLELFLDEKKEAHSTHILHVTSQEQAEWPGWDEARLVTFITQQAGVQATKPAAPSKPKVAEKAPAPSAYFFALHEMELRNSLAATPSRLIKVGTDFTLKISYALLDKLRGEPLNLAYQLFISAHQTNEPARSLIAHQAGTLTAAEGDLSVAIVSPHLPIGTYRLTALMFLTVADQPQQLFTQASLARVYQVY